MSEHKDLQNLVSVSSNTVIDKDGVAHHLTIPDLGDLADVYSRYGDLTALNDIARPGNPDFEKITFLLWLALRKEGRSEAQMDTGDWAYSLSAVGRLFTLKELGPVAMALVKLLIAGGIWSAAEDDSDPTKPGEEAGPKTNEESRPQTSGEKPSSP